MEKQAIKDLMYGGISELMQRRDYYYHSDINPLYSHWTDQGAEVLKNYVNDISRYIWDAEQEALDQRAKDIVLNELKK